MLKNFFGVILCAVMMLAIILPTATMGHAQDARTNPPHAVSTIPERKPLTGLTDDWILQWSHAYGGNGHAQFAQPIGDINGDGLNEVIIGGYENSGICRIIQYDATQHTYVEIYSWVVGGGSPSGACVVDLDEDGALEFCVSWTYSTANGVYAYKWDGPTPTQLDWYHGTGMDFPYDICACDYNDDGHTEILIANDPNPGGPQVTALGWNRDTNKFSYETSWTCPSGSGYSVPMVSSGDVDNDGKTEVIADVSDLNYATAGTWALNWNEDTQTWNGIPVCTNYPSGVTVFGDRVGDIDNDGTPEIGVGSYGGTPGGWLFEWTGTSYVQVWHGEYPGQDPVIESVDIGDADNDGNNEFCFGTGNVHIIGWNGTGYYEKATLTGPTNMLAGLNVGDCDSDGFNEVKGCEILGGTGTEFIWKHVETTPPMTTCTLDGEMDGSVYVSDVTVTLTATDVGSGVDFTMWKLDNGSWTRYDAPFVVSENGTHSVRYYSVDKVGNTEAENTTVFVISHHALLEVTLAGGIGVKMTVKNTGNSDQSMVPWNLTVHGGLILVGNQGKNGRIPQLNAGGETTLSLMVIGFGKTTISASAGLVSQNATARMFLFFVIGVK